MPLPYVLESLIISYTWDDENTLKILKMLGIKSLGFWCETLHHNLNKTQVQALLDLMQSSQKNRKRIFRWAVDHQVISLLDYCSPIKQTHEWLEECAANNKLQTIQWLWKTMSNQNRKIYGELALERACQSGHLNIVQKVDCLADNHSAVQAASGSGHLHIAPYLVEQKTDVTANDNYAARFASERGHLEFVKFLVEQKANVTAQDNFAVQWASACGKLELVKFLVHQKADVTANNNFAVEWASGNGFLPMVEFLVAQKADVIDNDAPLRLSIQGGYLDVVEFIREQKANQCNKNTVWSKKE